MKQDKNSVMSGTSLLISLLCLVGVLHVEFRLYTQEHILKNVPDIRDTRELFHRDRKEREAGTDNQQELLIRTRRGSTSVNISVLSVTISDIRREISEKLKDTLKTEVCVRDKRMCLRGPKGKRGRRGRPGTKGNIGIQGAPGPRSPRGPKGERGLRGPQGRNGEHGPPGPQGPEGKLGPSGPPGPAGPRGIKGERGDAVKSLFAPTIEEPQKRLVVNQSDTASFQCVVNGNPRPTVTWSRPNTLLPIGRHTVYTSGLLSIKQVTSSDSGSYICTATSVLGKAQAQAELVVQEPPRIFQRPKSVTVEKGDNVTLICAASGLPEPSISWSKSLGSLPAQTSTSKTGELRINRIKIDEGGTYICVVKNLMGRVSSHAQVTVVLGPSAKPKQACPTGGQLFCASDGKTYDSPCAMRKAAFQEKINISFVKRGQCDCTVIADVAFLVDSSGSVGRRNWARLLQFVSTTIRKLNVGPSATHVALIRYSTRAEVDFTFQQIQGSPISAATYTRIIPRLRWQRGFTFIDKALVMADQRVFTPAGRMRRDVPKIAFVLTDGKQTRGRDPITPLATASGRLKAKGVRVYAMGIGSNVSKKELNDIVSDPKYVYQARSFRHLTLKINGIVRSICEEKR